MSEEGKTFKEACCHRLGISPDAFEEAVLLECLTPSRAWAGRLMWYFDRAYFNPDLKLIRVAAACTSLKNLIVHINDDRIHREESSFGRKHLHIRMSGKRLVDFAGKFIPLR